MPWQDYIPTRIAQQNSGYFPVTCPKPDSEALLGHSGILTSAGLWSYHLQFKCYSKIAMGPAPQDVMPTSDTHVAASLQTY
jgi:hypothetical protein